MAEENQNTDNQIKTEQIVAAAQSIFGQYGMSKTTMKEIAAEMGISKALLYYYFPDKEHLYKTVVEKEHHEFITNLLERLSVMDNAENMLVEFVVVRLQYFRNLLNLSRFRMDDWPGMKPLMEDVWHTFRNKEIDVIQGILAKGKENGAFFITDLFGMAEMFIDLLKGISHIMLKKKPVFYLDMAEYDELVFKANSFTRLFIRALKNPEV